MILIRTESWVDNHWCLILWKLAGMVALDPEKEAIPDQRRWCWDEVIRQLLYRYERELNSGVRPPLRKIANQDVSSQLPLCLCISNIVWSPGGVTEDGLPIEPHPELELTDGWYRLRAQVDLPMARAVRKGVIRVGRKLGIAAARLDTEKKEASEVLEAYDSCKLVLSGNSSQLMPWHAKLGFINGRCISTLHSLSPDGGLVAALDFVIVKLYPIAFLEFKEDENGNKHREGPRAEAEEMKVQDQWNRRRQLEASKLHEELDKKYSRYESYISRMEQKAARLKVLEGDPPQEIESLFDRLEYADTAIATLSRLTPTQAGWLAQYTKQQIDSGRAVMAEEIEQDLQVRLVAKICPPREVKSFRVLVTQDARTQRRPANRTAQLTVWDVISLSLDEGSSGGNFVVGQRYVATNLLPQQQSSWMDCELGSEIYLSTRRDTRWTRIKTVVR
ncbi:hypothetical protein CPB83DRAFT_867793 [Crepidotus variabilis]|uniref:BRCA2 OB1 domain-containing protein n=1 Tax=Crepidotus variabilis TaxID=179855 RepID=A0A9P6JT29_9AGAR|nr:hypothetical protein CPB83DRAFT_867793 [Crepidotus variabilis]